MSSKISSAYDKQIFNEPDHFILRHDSEPVSFPEESDHFADSQIDELIEDTEYRSARAFNDSVDYGQVSTRRPKSSRRRNSKNHDPKSDQPQQQQQRRNLRSMLTLPLVVIAIVGLLVMLLISNSTRPDKPFIEIRSAAPSTLSYPIIQLPPSPPRIPPLRTPKLPRHPPSPALLDSTDPTPVPTPPLTYR